MASMPPTMIWGEGLFECENHFDDVLYLNREMGVNDLELAANAEAGGEVVHYSIYAPSCSNKAAAEAVKKYLDAGALKKMCAKMITRFFDPVKPSDFTCHGRLPIVLGACAMTLGCKLEGIPGYKKMFPSYKSFLGGIFANAPLLDLAKQQMHEVVYGTKHPYMDGQAYDFKSRTYAAVMAARVAGEDVTKSPHWTGRGVVNGVPVGYKPREMGKPPIEGMAVSLFGPWDKEDMGYTKDGGCGAIDCGKEQTVDGRELLQCGRCQEVKYCSPLCQWKDWARHKLCCRTPEDEVEMRKEGAKWTNIFWNDLKPQLVGTFDADAMSEGTRRLYSVMKNKMKYKSS